MKNKIIKNLAAAGLFALTAVSPQILGANNQTVNAMIEGDSDPTPGSGSPQAGKEERKVEISSSSAKGYIENGKIKIADGTTQVIIHPSAFYENKDIKSLEFPDSVKMISFGERCFAKSGIENLKLPQDAERITFARHSFAYSEELKSPLIFGDADVISFEMGAFGHSSVPAINFTKSVGELSFGGSSFYNSSIGGLDIPKGTKLNSIEPAAFSFTNLKKVDFSKIDAPETFVFYLMAFASSNIEELNLPNAKDIRFQFRSFNDVKKLGELNIPDTVKNISFGMDSFSYCSISNVNIPAEVKISNIEKSAFEGTENLKIFDLSEIAPTDTFTFNEDAFKSSNIEEIKLPNARSIRFEESSFSGTTLLDNLSIPESVTRTLFGKKSFDGSKIKRIEFLSTSDYAEQDGVPIGSQVTFDEMSFDNTQDLEELDLPKNLYSLSLDKTACKRLTALDLSETHLKNLDIPENAFFESDIQELTLPACLESLTIGANAFKNSKITEIRCPDDNILKTVRIGNTAFDSTPFKGFNLKSFKNLTKFSCGKSAFSNSDTRGICLPDETRATIMLSDEALKDSKITDLDLSNLHPKARLCVAKGTFTGSSIKSLKLPYKSQIKFSPGLPKGVTMSTFLGCGKNVEVTEKVDGFSSLVFSSDIKQEEEDNNDTELVNSLELDEEKLMRILTGNYPIRAEVKRKTHDVTFNSMSSESAKAITDSIVLLENFGWPTQRTPDGNSIADITNCKRYIKIPGSVLNAQGWEYYPAICKSDQNDGYEPSQIAVAKGWRIIKLGKKIFVTWHHNADIALCVHAAKGNKFESKIGQIRFPVFKGNNKEYKWSGSYVI